MTPRSLRILIFGGLVLMALTALGYFFGSGSRYDWHFRFDEFEEAEPYSVSTAYHLLTAQHGPIDVAPRNWEKLKSTDAQTLLLVGQGFLINDDEAASLLNWVRQGHTAFLSSRVFPLELWEPLANVSCLNRSMRSTNRFENGGYTDLSLTHPVFDALPAARVRYITKKRDRPYAWSYFPEQHIRCDGQADDYPETNSYEDNFMEGQPFDSTFLVDAGEVAVIGYSEGTMPNFLRFPLGEGTIYLHSVPEVFTNIILDSLENFEYFQGLSAHFPQGKVTWDRFHLASEDMVYRSNANRYRRRGRGERYQNPQMAYVFSQPALTWAWYVFLSLVVLYLLFNTKRRQRVMPVLAEKRNTSIALIKSIGNLTFQQQNHRDVALEAFELYLNNIRWHYQLPTDNYADDDFLKTLAARSGIHEPHLRKIGQLARNIMDSGYVSNKALIELHQLIDYFYQHRK